MRLFPRRDCVVVLAGVKAVARWVAVPALMTPGAGADLGRRSGTDAGVVSAAGSGAGVRLVEEALANNLYLTRAQPTVSFAHIHAIHITVRI